MNTEYLRMPALMEEQKAAGSKDKYIEITDTLVAARAGLKSTAEKTDYLKALADTLLAMDFQVYELYRKLQDILKAVLKEVLNEYDTLSDNEKEKVSEVVEKACGLGILLKEKYEKYLKNI